MDHKLQTAIDHREGGNPELAAEIIVKLLKHNPGDGNLNYQYAWTLDVQGLEREAVPYYQKAIEAGLDGDDLQDAYLGLGSTLRTIGNYEESISLLREALEQFDNNALRVFLAMSLYNQKEYPESMYLLLSVISLTSQDKNILKYRKSIEFYSDKLDKRW